VVSLLVAVGALLVTVVVVYNGSSRQQQFEARRQACLVALTDYAGTLIEIDLGDSAPDADLFGDLVARRALNDVQCFSAGILREDSEFVEEWRATERAMDVGWWSLDATDPPLSLIGDAQQKLISQLLSAIDDALVAVIEAPGPGFWPWDLNVPLSPETFPPFPIETDAP
jgi:hypothetical protein